MNIAIASGKGGTGKTLVATNLALAAADRGEKVQLLDCDVEEPNCHIFLTPHIESVTPVAIPIPEVLMERCNGCGVCAEVCEYNAIAVFGKSVLIFPELCHSCGACSLFCPEKAIFENVRTVGSVETGFSQGIRLIQGQLSVGEVRSPAVIRSVKNAAQKEGVILIDSPPGTSCPVIESVKDADMILLVTEPTPFGLNDLEIAVGMVRILEKPFAVIVNRCDVGNEGVIDYCAHEGIDTLMEIPYDRRIAEVYSRGYLVISSLPHYRETFDRCWERIECFVKAVHEGCKDSRRAEP